MFLVQLLRETEGQLHPLVDVHPHLPCVAQVMVDVLNVPGKMASLCCQAEVVLLVVHRQVAHLVLCCYEAPHLLGEVANPLLLMLEYQPVATLLQFISRLDLFTPSTIT